MSGFSLVSDDEEDGVFNYFFQILHWPASEFAPQISVYFSKSAVAQKCVCDEVKIAYFEKKTPALTQSSPIPLKWPSMFWSASKWVKEDKFQMKNFARHAHKCPLISKWVAV